MAPLRSWVRLLPAMLVGLALVGAAAQNSVAAARKQAEAPKPFPEHTFVGTIDRIDYQARQIQARLLLGRRTFDVPPDATIVIRTGADGRLEDLRKGDEVEIRYRNIEGRRLVFRLSKRGVTPEDREEVRERERIQDILTPDPSERGLQDTPLP